MGPGSCGSNGKSVLFKFKFIIQYSSFSIRCGIALSHHTKLLMYMYVYIYIYIYIYCCLTAQSPYLNKCWLLVKWGFVFSWRIFGQRANWLDPKSPTSWLFTQAFVQAYIKENIKAPRHWPLWGDSTGTGGSPSKRASNAWNGWIW